MKLADIDLLDLDRFWRREHDEMFTLLREEAPVFWHEEPDGPGFWNLSKHADLVQTNRDPILFSSEVGGISRFDFDPETNAGGMDTRGIMMLTTDPPKHTRYRRLVNKGFTPRMIGKLEEALRYRAVDIVNQVIERGECDFVVDLAAELPLQAIAEIMGVPQEDRYRLFDWSNRMIGIDDPEYANEDSAVASMELYAFANNLAKERANEPKDDIVTLLVNATIGDDRLSEIEFDAFMLLLTVAGNETTRNATSGGMLALLRHPEEMAKLREDIDGRLDTAVEEILRWSTPVMHFRRTATEDTEINGQKIAKGDKVLMWHVSANRDEEVFDEPFKFDIQRTPNEHISFGGGGAHYCLGANLARAELRIIFREMLTRMDDIQMAGEPDFLRSNFIQGIKHMPITFAPGEQKAPSGAVAVGAAA